jgi:hypothetical protein
MLFLELAAADAWPLIPHTTDIAVHRDKMIMGDWETILTPRCEAVPVRLCGDRSASEIVGDMKFIR